MYGLARPCPRATAHGTQPRAARGTRRAASPPLPSRLLPSLDPIASLSSLSSVSVTSHPPPRPSAAPPSCSSVFLPPFVNLLTDNRAPFPLLLCFFLSVAEHRRCPPLRRSHPSTGSGVVIRLHRLHPDTTSLSFRCCSLSPARCRSPSPFATVVVLFSSHFLVFVATPSPISSSSRHRPNRLPLPLHLLRLRRAPTVVLPFLRLHHRRPPQATAASVAAVAPAPSSPCRRRLPSSFLPSPTHRLLPALPLPTTVATFLPSIVVALHWCQSPSLASPPSLPNLAVISSPEFLVFGWVGEDLG